MLVITAGLGLGGSGIMAGEGDDMGIGIGISGVVDDDG